MLGAIADANADADADADADVNADVNVDRDVAVDIVAVSAVAASDAFDIFGFVGDNAATAKRFTPTISACNSSSVCQSSLCFL